jgi:hypothetical protein
MRHETGRNVGEQTHALFNCSFLALLDTVRTQTITNTTRAAAP